MAVVYTDVGAALVVDTFDGTVAPATHYISSGTGASAAAKGSTVLSTEQSEARVSATKTQPTADKNQWQGTVTYTGTKTITNAGVLTATSAGTLILMADSLSVAVLSGDAIQFTFTLQQT